MVKYIESGLYPQIVVDIDVLEHYHEIQYVANKSPHRRPNSQRRVLGAEFCYNQTL